MLKKIFASLCTVSSLWMVPNVYALDISALGGVSISNLSHVTTLATSSTTGSGYALGALAAINFTPMLAIEAGVFHIQHIVNLTGLTSSPGNSGSITLNNLSVPAMLRFTPVSFFAIEAGGYFGLGSTANVTTVAGGTSSNSNLAATQDHGLIGGVSLFLPLANFLKLRFSGFYEYGLTNLIGNASPAVNLNSIDVMGGVMLSI